MEVNSTEAIINAAPAQSQSQPPPNPEPAPPARPLRAQRQRTAPRGRRRQPAWRDPERDGLGTDPPPRSGHEIDSTILKRPKMKVDFGGKRRP